MPVPFSNAYATAAARDRGPPALRRRTGRRALLKHVCISATRGEVRISTKLALGLSLVSGCILGGYGYWQYQQEEYDLRLAAERDFRMLGVAVRVAVENSLRDKQTADLHEILDSLEVREPDLDVVVVDPR